MTKHDRANPIQLDQGENVYVSDAHGTTWVIGVSDTGHLEVWLPAGGTILNVPSSSSNVQRLVNWPTFQPVVPPTEDSLVQASFDHLRALLPNGNGMGHEKVEAVQRALDGSAAVRSVIEGVIHQTLEVVQGGPYGSDVKVRESAKPRGECDANCGPVGHVTGCAANRAAA
jgi:hypothetical protein